VGRCRWVGGGGTRRRRRRRLDSRWPEVDFRRAKELRRNPVAEPRRPVTHATRDPDRTRRDLVLHGDFPTRFSAVGGFSPVVSVGGGRPSDLCVCKTRKTHQSHDPVTRETRFSMGVFR
jgi:hypothetical protein